MLILPDVRGLHAFYEELALRFAEAGMEAVAIDYFGRTAPPPPRDSDFEHNPHVDQTRYATVLQDMAAGRNYLAQQSGVRALFSVGFCYGGRLAFLSAGRQELGLTGAIGFYGIVGGKGRVDLPSPTELVRPGQAAVLGLFGGDDPSIPPASIAEFGARLESAAVDHELITYRDAPHSFFDRKAAEWSDASADAWQRVRDFVARLTPAAG